MNKYYAAIARSVLEKISLEPLRNKEILITGSNGLLGSHFVAAIALANKTQGLNAKVTGVSRGPLPLWLVEIFTEKKFQFIQKDLGKEKLPSFENSHFDFVIHAATYAQPKKFLQQPLETMRLNSTISMSLLELCARSKASFLFLSSSEVYGNPPQEMRPTLESYPGNASSLDPRAPYATSKRFTETLCKVYNDAGMARCCIARVAPTYGPGVSVSDDRVWNELIRRALTADSFRLLDNGQQQRRWLYISDAIIMLFHALLYSRELVYNVGGTDFRSIHELATYVSKNTKTTLQLPESDAMSSHALGAPAIVDVNSEKIRKEVGLSSLVNLEDGISSCVNWTRSLLEIA